MQPETPSVPAAAPGSGPRRLTVFVLLLATCVIAAFAVGYLVGLRQPPNYRSSVRVSLTLGDVSLRWSEIGMVLLCHYDYNVTVSSTAPVLVNVTVDLHTSLAASGGPTSMPSELRFYEVPSFGRQISEQEREWRADNYTTPSECPVLTVFVDAYYVSS